MKKKIGPHVAMAPSWKPSEAEKYDYVQCRMCGGWIYHLSVPAHCNECTKTTDEGRIRRVEDILYDYEQRNIEPAAAVAKLKRALR